MAFLRLIAKMREARERQAGARTRFDYFRAGSSLSWAALASLFSIRIPSSIALALGLLCASSGAQYVGKVTNTDDKKPVLRSVAVLEWVGSPGKPSASRLVPVSVYDGQQLNDGTIYLPEPHPLAVSNGIEYELQTAGKPIGLYDLLGVGKEDGVWEGFGAWKPLTAPEAKKAENAFNSSSLNNGGFGDDDDKPVLKRKHPKGTDSDDAASASASGTAKPGLASGTGAASADPDRPTLHRNRHAEDAELSSSNAAPDPDRPRLKHGKPAGTDEDEIPALRGFPPSMQQAVAVSDAYDHAEHPWKYSWANPDDEAKFKEALEAIARKELGLDLPAKPAAPPSAAKTAARKKTPLVPLAPPPPPPLADEQFRVFELAYGATATMVLTASTPLPPPAANSADTNPTDGSNEPPPPTIKRGKPAPTSTAASSPASSSGNSAANSANRPKPAPQKFVTLIAQPDLYGGVMVLMKSVTDAAHLDDTPRMRLVDAVDAMADNRGELLFELRGKTQRQFALIRVLRGSAEQLFATVALQ